MKTLLMLCVMAAIAWGVQPVHAQFWQRSPKAETNTVNLVNDVDIEQKLNAQVPLDLRFRNEKGEPVVLGEFFKDKPVILTLVYYECPSLCNLVLNGVTKSLKTLRYVPGKEFEVVTISISPKETPELAARKKHAYIKEYGRLDAAKGWHFLTGDEASIRQVADAVGFRYKYDPKSGQFAHGAGIMVLTPQGRVARYFFGIEYATRDLRMALIDASQGRVGSPVEKILLFCYQYDPSSGKYSLAIVRVIQVASAATLLLLGGFMLTMFYLDKRQAKPQRGGG